MHETSHRRFSDELSRWLGADGDKTLGSIVETFEEKSFAVLFVVLLGVPALPIPTGGATHVLEAIAMLLALQLLAGREKVWLPQRWRAVTLAGPKRERFLERLLTLIRWLERRSHPRGRILFGSRTSNRAFGALVMVGTLAAFVAPPFSWLDTLPALGVVLLSLGVLLEDVLVAAAGIVVGAGGIALVVLLGRAAIRGVAELALLAISVSPTPYGAAATPIYRAPMRARDMDVPPGAGAEYGLDRGLVGIGPGRGDKASRMLHRFATLPEGVFVWTRDRAGRFHLGRVGGPLRQDDSDGARAVGITHVRPTAWLGRAFTEDEVPAAVARTFARGGRNLQRTHDDHAERLTAELWERG